jgi:hypothetical protein
VDWSSSSCPLFCLWFNAASLGKASSFHISWLISKYPTLVSVDCVRDFDHPFLNSGIRSFFGIRFSKMRIERVLQYGATIFASCSQMAMGISLDLSSDCELISLSPISDLTNQLPLKAQQAP